MAQPRSLADIETWIEDHPQWPCPSDVIHHVFASVAPLMGFTTVPRGTKPETMNRVNEVEKARALRVEWSLKWLGPRREFDLHIYPLT
jgi:hypothetical protein